MRFDFDSSGNLTSIQDRNGNSLTFGYAGANLTSITDSFGRSVSLAYDGSNRLQTLSAGSRTVTYTYTGTNLTRVDFPDSSFVTYDYSDPNDAHNMTAARDSATPTPHVIEAHTYYANDTVQTTQADGGNYFNTLVYDSATQTTVTNCRSVQTVYTHDAFSGLVTASNGPGCTSCGGGTNTSLTYDNFLNVKERVDGRGVHTQMTYDGKGNVLTRKEAAGTPRERTWTYTHQATFNFPATITIPTVGTGTCAVSNPNKVVTNTYDSGNGDLLQQQVTGCNGSTSFTHTTTSTYSHGQPATVNGPRTDVPDVTTYDYYPDNDANVNKRARLQRVTNALSQQTNYAGYDLFGNVGSVTDPNNVETDYLYDGKDRVTEVRIKGATAAEDIVTENQYDTIGNLDFVRLPNCVETGVGCAFSLDYVYDAVNRQKEIHDAVGNKIVYTYDTEGNRTREEYQDSGAAVHRFTNFAYDNFNRLQYIYFTNPMTPPGTIYHEYTYFNDGARQTERDPMNHTTSFAYDELKRLTTTTQTVGASSLVTTYGYDGQDNLNSVSAPNSPSVPATTYKNGDMGWRLSATSPDTGTTSYVYDPAGNLTTTTNAIPVTVTRTYDALNRLLTVTYPTSSLNVTYTYDAPDSPSGSFFNIGGRTGMTDPSGASAYHYNRRGLLKKEEKTIGSRTYTTKYDYDKTGNLTQILYPTESPFLRQGEVDYHYDAADRVSLITTKVNGSTTTVASGFSYKPFGPRTGMTFGNSLVDARSYGTRYQLGTWTLGSILNYTHTFDNDLNLTNRTDNLTAANNRGFGYDEVHRLTQAAGPWGAGTACTGSVTYTYDLNGNRQCKGEGAPATNYTYTASTNRLASSTGGEAASYSYNNNGNITGDGTHTYQYSQADRLATVDSGSTAAYTYDGDGRRVIKTSGITTYFLYDPNGRLLTEIVPSGTRKDYLYLLSDPLGRVDWAVSETNLTGDPLRLKKMSPNVRLDWILFPAGGHQYVVRRKQVVNPNDKTFNGSTVIAGVSDPATHIYDNPVLNDGNRYDYKVLRKSSNDVLLFYHTDHLGTPNAMTDGTGTLAWRAEHRPFGGIHSLPVSLVENNVRFLGQYASEGNQYYNLFRSYAPGIGRYLEPDPLGLGGGSNLYIYVLDNPITLDDPLGLKVRVCCKAIPVTGRLKLKHCYFEFDDGSTIGFHTPATITNISAAIVCATTGAVQKNAGFDLDVTNPSSCGPWSPGCADDCVRKGAAEYPSPSQYCLFGPNSNTFTGTVERRCPVKPPSPQDILNAPGWHDAPPAGNR